MAPARGAFIAILCYTKILVDFYITNQFLLPWQTKPSVRSARTPTRLARSVHSANAKASFLSNWPKSAHSGRILFYLTVIVTDEFIDPAALVAVRV